VLAVEAGHVRALTRREAAASLDAAPPVCHLGRAFGLDPVPVAVEEARRALAGREIPLRRPVPSPSTVGAPVLEACGLSVSYGAIAALDGVALTVREGEAVALVGANGSGKSTLFRAVAGLVTPSRGTVRLAGRPAPSRVQERTAVAGLVPQDPALALYRDTVRDEVAETRKLRRMEHASATQLGRWGLEALAARNPRDLSVGQQQRVAVAAMLAHEPRLWLMDEPTRGADHLARQWLATTVREHVNAGGAAVVATHDFETAAHFATRVVGLEQGRVAFDLPAAQAFAADGPCATQIARLVPGALTMEDLS
jgi:energy-coupling factor transport system ATP-binding protein